MIDTTNVKMCKKCGSINTHIYESRQQHNEDGDVYVMRRRLCHDWGFRWKTIEVDYWDYMHLIEGK